MTGPPERSWPRDGVTATGPEDDSHSDSSTVRESDNTNSMDPWDVALLIAKRAAERDRADARRRIMAGLAGRCELDRRQILRLDDAERELRVLKRIEKFLDDGGSDE